MKRIILVGIIAVIISGIACLIGANYTPKAAATPINTIAVSDMAVVEVITDIYPVESTPETQTAIESTTEAVTEAFEPKVYNTILPEWVQDIIIAECGDVIAPEIVMAMVEKESGGDQYAIGDDGRSLGLMQIQPKHHIKTMIALNSTDLFDVQENIRVGVAILKDLLNRYGSINAAIVAYNAGSYEGYITNYGYDVLARAERIG